MFVEKEDVRVQTAMNETGCHQENLFTNIQSGFWAVNLPHFIVSALLKQVFI